jgi:hypothetical protein
MHNNQNNCCMLVNFTICCFMYLRKLTWQNASYCFLRHHESSASISWPNLTWMSGGLPSWNYKHYLMNKTTNNKHYYSFFFFGIFLYNCLKIFSSHILFNLSFTLYFIISINDSKVRNISFKNTWTQIKRKIECVSQCIQPPILFKAESPITFKTLTQYSMVTASILTVLIMLHVLFN